MGLVFLLVGIGYCVAIVAGVAILRYVPATSVPEDVELVTLQEMAPELFED